MSNISKITEILGKAKEGQFISLKCEGSSTDFFAEVVQLGTDKVQAVKAEDWEEGWPKDESTELGPLCFTTEQANVKIRFDTKGQWPEDFNYLNYSTDGKTWNKYTGQEITLALINDKVYFNTPDGITNHAWGNDYEFVFKSTGPFAASGNIMSLVVKDGLTDTIPQELYYFYGLFYECGFLTNAPALPATTLAHSCYSNMFFGCTSLTSAPELPAMTLADQCYDRMFQGCTSLTYAPTLPAEILVDSCYSEMFKDCSNLSSIEVNFTAWDPTDTATCDWVNGVSSTGTFKCPTALPQTRGNNNIPNGWTIETK